MTCGNAVSGVLATGRASMPCATRVVQWHNGRRGNGPGGRPWGRAAPGPGRMCGADAPCPAGGRSRRTAWNRRRRGVRLCWTRGLPRKVSRGVRGRPPRPFRLRSLCPFSSLWCCPSALGCAGPGSSAALGWRASTPCSTAACSSTTSCICSPALLRPASSPCAPRACSHRRSGWGASTPSPSRSWRSRC